MPFRATLAYDPWAWLVWGREVTRLDLATVGGPSWKPLPVVVTTLLAPLGDLAPAAWLVVARTAGLLAVVLVFVLASRVAGRAAGFVAAGLLLFAPDGDPRFVRLVLEGHSAPATAALALGAIELHLRGRRALAFACVLALSLDRPEAWPFLGAYGLWLWVHDRRVRPLVVAAPLVVAGLWFGADWWGSGSALHGADAARVVTADADSVSEALVRVTAVVLPPAWIATIVAVAHARRRGDRLEPALLAGALAWFAIVVALNAAFGYAALSRFLLPGAALLCVLAGIGAVVVARAVQTHDTAARVLAVVLVASTLVSMGWRIRAFGPVADEMTNRATLVSQFDDVIETSGGVERVLACGQVDVDDGGVPRMALAWKLDVPLHSVRRHLGRTPAVVFVRTAKGMRWLREQRNEGVDVVGLASSARWRVAAVGCDGLADRVQG